MQVYSKSGSPSIVNNSPCSFSGSFDIGASIARRASSFEHTYESKKELVSLFCSSSNLTKNFFFYTTFCTQITTSLIVLVLLHSVVFSSISPIFSFTTYPTPIFVLIRFLSIIFFLIVTTVDIMVKLGGGAGGVLAISLVNSKCAVDIFFV